MRCAIYARRSTEEHQADSLAVQTEDAARYAAARGWTVVQTYSEDGVSRAEFVNRPALARMLLGAKAKAFDVVVTRDETRLGGDIYRTGMVIQELTDHGVRLHYYAAGGEVQFNDPTAKLMSALRGFAAELEREKIAERTRDNHAHKARRGLVTGGKVFGYDNVPVMDGERRAHVVLVGPEGSGKRTALAHLAAVFADEPELGIAGRGFDEAGVLAGHADGDRSVHVDRRHLQRQPRLGTGRH